MPPEGYTTVTITEETAGKLAELAALSTKIDSMDEAIEHAADHVLAEQGTISNADLARLLHERLSTE